MDTNASQNQTNPSVQNAKLSNPITNIGTIKPVLDRARALLPLVDDVSEMFSDHVFDLLFRHVREMSKNEISKVSMGLYNMLRNFGRCPSPAKIEKMISDHLGRDVLWQSRTYVFEKDGQIHIKKSKSETVAVSNFILVPKYVINVYQGHRYHVYDVIIKNHPEVYQIMLKAEDFNKLETLQDEISKQLMGTSAYINGCSSYMKDLAYKYIDLAVFEHAKQGTSLLGLERLEDGGLKYFCTPHAIYSVETGEVCGDIVYMGNEEANMEEIRTWTNLKYDKEKWPAIAKEFLANVIRIQDKWQMMKLAGWVGVIPHDYVMRKETGFGAFPHCHIVGEPGAGKTTIMTLMKQFMGHNDSAPRSFTSAFELQKLLNTSYTIPTILDEYGKRWNIITKQNIERTLTESFTRGRFSKGRSDQTSVYYKYKNPVLMGGQIPIDDIATAQRVVEVRFSKSFHNTPEGKVAKDRIERLQKMPDKNFWVGYCIWCARFENEDVLVVQRRLEERVRNLGISDPRRSTIMSMVLVGLHYMKLLAEQLGVDIGYTEEDMDELIRREASERMEEETELDRFLRAVADFGITHGNRNNYFGTNFGKYRNVMYLEPTDKGPGKYGRNSDHDACIYGKELILIKIEPMAEKLRMNAKEVQVAIDAEFERSMQNPESSDNLVLAPKQYRTRSGMYTAFSKDALIQRHPEFEYILDLIKKDDSDSGVRVQSKSASSASKSAPK